MQENKVRVRSFVSNLLKVAEMHKMLMQAFSNEALGKTQKYDWSERFKNLWPNICG